MIINNVLRSWYTTLTELFFVDQEDVEKKYINGSFHGVFNTSDYTASKNRTVNHALERMWKKRSLPNLKNCIVINLKGRGKPRKVRIADLETVI
jgi:hypothetical protein